MIREQRQTCGIGPFVVVGRSDMRECAQLAPRAPKTGVQRSYNSLDTGKSAHLTQLSSIALVCSSSLRPSCGASAGLGRSLVKMIRSLRRALPRFFRSTSWPSRAASLRDFLASVNAFLSASRSILASRLRSRALSRPSCSDGRISGVRSGVASSLTAGASLRLSPSSVRRACAADLRTAAFCALACLFSGSTR